MSSKPQSHDLPFGFALLQQTTRSQFGRNRWALLWWFGLLLLIVGSLLMLVLYLQSFEAQEEARTGRADALVVEQATQFHFRRLEDDLMTLARKAITGQETTEAGGAQHRGDEPPAEGGHLWREDGVVLSHGWIAAGAQSGARGMPQRWLADRTAHSANVEFLDSMGDIARGLRRSAYAGPMRNADGTLTSVVWLAVPFFERGQFAGNYLAALSMDHAAQALAPDWFEPQQKMRLLVDDLALTSARTPWAGAHIAAMNLPGVDLYLEVSPRSAQPATAPRIFFLAALLFLIGMFVSLFALRRDFVKRQNIQALLQAEVALRSAMENSVTMGLRAWDLKGKILYVNAAFCRMVGYDATELVGKSAPLPYWPVDQFDELRQVHRLIIAQGTLGDGVEVQFQHRNGRLVDVLIHEAPLNTASGERIGWMSSVLDISERKRAQRMAVLQQDKLEASGRLVAVGEVASTLAHELNQPLGALSSFANGLLNRLRGDSITMEEMVPVVARMAGLAERAGGIIQRVNAFARQREIILQRLDMVAFLQRVVAGTAVPHGSPVLLIAPDAPIWIDADELLFEHLVNNLVGNALDWAHRGGRPAQVRVAVAHDAVRGMATMVVSDTGPGVSDDERAHIFNAFFSTKDGGMGMGLAICRSIVEAHHGRIDVGHDPDLGGARFTIWLPLALDPAPVGDP
jgi:two-component system sensor histidine kinase DctS